MDVSSSSSALVRSAAARGFCGSWLAWSWVKVRPPAATCLPQSLLGCLTLAYVTVEIVVQLKLFVATGLPCSPEYLLWLLSIFNLQRFAEPGIEGHLWGCCHKFGILQSKLLLKAFSAPCPMLAWAVR